jgi:uncharacterized surface protein with fasciclin (FAS1) repeats
MKTTILTLFAFFAIASMTSAGSCGSSKAHTHEAKATTTALQGPSDIIETALSDDNFTTLVAAIKAAGLVEALQGEGPFTVFAPTDEAFAELPEGTLEALLKDTKKLASILTYHVVEGAVSSSQVIGLDEAQTLNGQSIAIATKDGQVTINDANVIVTDILCSNGVIHVLDKVILPSMEKI